MCVSVCVAVMHRPFLPCAAMGDKQPRGTGSLLPNKHTRTHTGIHTHTQMYAHTHAHTSLLLYDRFPSLFLSPFSRYFLLLLCCQEKTGVNHYRQYRLKMQSPPGAQGHWRLMGGRKSVRVQTRTGSHPTVAACKQSDWAADCLPSSPCLFLAFSHFSCGLILLHSVSSISSPA